MTYAWLLETWPLHLFSFIVFTTLVYKWCNTKLNLPPYPPKLPIIGNLHQFGRFPHRNLRSLSQKYGEYMFLYMGNRPTVVISSATAAENIMKTHDLIFANRPKLRFVNRIFYDGNDIAFSSYGEKWRQMKAICVLKVLNNKSVQSYRKIREEEVSCVIETIKSYNGAIINISETLVLLFNGIICRTTLGRKYDHGHDFYKVMKELGKVMGEVSVGDYVPFLGWIDKLSGLEGRAENLRKRFDDFITEVIHEHQDRVNVTHVYNEDEKPETVKDFVDILLETQQENPEQLSTQSLKALILDMFVGGTESLSTLLIWVMTELIRHPKIMKELQYEVSSIVKPNGRVTEDDLINMKYLKAVIKETLRLHPPIPLMVFRESAKNVKIDEYHISAGTQVIINACAIQLDPKAWHNPDDFIPERFLKNSSSIDFQGQHFQLIPFGAGRRGCPGIAYTTANVEFVLANLVYEFDWKLPNGREGETLDVEECPGITIGRRNPLMVVATPSN